LVARFEIWAVGSVWEKEDPSKSSYLEKVQERKTPKSFGLHDFRKFYVL